MSYSPEWIPVVLLLGLIALPAAPPLAMVALVILLLVAVTLLLALAGTIAAAPYLLFRSVRSQWREHGAGRWNEKPLRPGLAPVAGKEV